MQVGYKGVYIARTCFPDVTDHSCPINRIPGFYEFCEYLNKNMSLSPVNFGLTVEKCFGKIFK